MISFDNWDVFNKLENIEITEREKGLLYKYYNILLEENSKYNLTSITELNDVYIKHFYDSLIFTNNINIKEQSICDIGTGAGFPGIVLKIMFPKIRLTLVESNSKKVNFLKLICEELNLNDVFFSQQRAEEFTVDNKEKYDIVISRAMAPLNILLELGAKGVKMDGYFICLKSKTVFEEMKILNNKESVLGLKLDCIQEYKDDFLGERNNVFYKKNKNTPDFYPRNYSQIKKKPLGT